MGKVQHQSAWLVLRNYFWICQNKILAYYILITLDSQLNKTVSAWNLLEGKRAVTAHCHTVSVHPKNAIEYKRNNGIDGTQKACIVGHVMVN